MLFSQNERNRVVRSSRSEKVPQATKPKLDGVRSKTGNELDLKIRRCELWPDLLTIQSDLRALPKYKNCISVFLLNTSHFERFGPSA